MLLPNNLIKSRALCASTLLSMIDLSAYSEQVEYVKFTVNIATEPTEVVFKVSNGTPEIDEDFKHPQQKVICNRFDEATNFFISTSSVRKFEPANKELTWVDGKCLMVLTPRPIEIVEEVIEVDTTQEDTQDSVLVEEVIVSNSTNTESLSLVEEVIEQPNEVVTSTEKSTVGDNEIPVTIVDDEEEVYVSPRISVFVASKNTENKTVKKKLDIEVKDLLPLLDAWLVATQQKAAFTKALSTNDHNSLVLYLYPSYTWEVVRLKKPVTKTFEQELVEATEDICKVHKLDYLSDKCFQLLKAQSTVEDFKHYQRVRESLVNKKGYHKSERKTVEILTQLRQKLESSERIQQITNRTGAVIQRSGKEPIPLLGNLFYISPIRVKDKNTGNLYLAQTYLEKIGNTFTQVHRKVAVFEGGTLQYFDDLDAIEKAKHDIKPLVVADGRTIFPDLSILKVRLEYLEPDCTNSGTFSSAYRDYYLKNTGDLTPSAPIKRKIDDRDSQISLYKALPQLYYLLKCWEIDLFLLLYLSLVTIPELDYLQKDEQGNYISVSDLVVAPVTFQGFTHPNLSSKKVREQEKPQLPSPKPVALDAAKTITGSKLITKGVIVTTPMVITLEDEADKWKISGLPVKTPPYDLAIYLSDKLGIKDLIIHIDTALSGLSLDSEEHKLLSLLKNDLLTGYKISKEQLHSSTKVIQGCLDRAIPTHKALYLDNYYCPHVLGYVEFLEDKEKEFLTYALRVWGSERDTRRSEIPTVMDWLRRIPINLRKEFKSSYPSINQIEKYLHSKFNFRNCSLSVSNQFQGNTGIFVEVYYKGRLQTRQMLSITTPVHNERNKGKIAVNISHRFNPMPPSTYLEVLKLSVAQKHLYQEAIGQLNRVSDKWVSTNKIRFVGKDKVGSVVSVNNIVGFDSTAKSINQVLGTFKKWATPFTVHSEVEKGKLINLLTLQTYTEFDVIELLQSLTNGWKYWEKSKAEHIELGGQQVYKSDPGRLMMNVHHLVSDTPDISEIVWKDTINTFYQITGLAVGFRCTNGVVLTPYDMYLSGVDRWTHRIKIQLISLLFLDQYNRQSPARQQLKLAAQLLEEAKETDDQDTKNDLVEEAQNLKESTQIELRKATFGSVESWLQYSIESLEEKLTTIDPKWKTTKANEDINKHIEAMKEALEISKEIELSV